MKRNVSIGMFLLLTLLTVTLTRWVSGAEQVVEPQGKTMLFDGESFEGWFRYSRGGKGPVDATWQIKPGGILACNGKPAGYIRTTNAYKNYKFHMEYRWPGRTRNNGILVHMQGEDRVWPKSLAGQGGSGAPCDVGESG